MPVFRDIIFSIVAIYWLFVCLWNEEITLFDSIGFLVLYAAYVVVIFLMSVWEKKRGDRARADTWNVETDDCPIENPNFDTKNVATEENQNATTLAIESGENPNFVADVDQAKNESVVKDIQVGDNPNFLENEQKNENVVKTLQVGDNPNFKG